MVAVTIATHRRALLLLAALAGAAQQRGHALTFRDEDGSKKLAIVLGDDILGLSVVACLEPKDHVLTSEEERRAAAGYEHGIPKHE